MSEDRVNEHEIQVSITCNLPTLRELHKCVTKCYQNWPGGHPQEQVKLDEMRSSLYVILLDSLFENDLV